MKTPAPHTSTQFAGRHDRIDAPMATRLISEWGEALNRGDFARCRRVQHDLRALGLAVLWLPRGQEARP